MNFNLDDYVTDLLYTYDDVDKDGKKIIEEFFSTFKINNGQDTDIVIEECVKSEMSINDCKIVLNLLEKHLVD
jgi:hypothetical protein